MAMGAYRAAALKAEPWRQAGESVIAEQETICSFQGVIEVENTWDILVQVKHSHCCGEGSLAPFARTSMVINACHGHGYEPAISFELLVMDERIA